MESPETMDQKVRIENLLADNTELVRQLRESREETARMKRQMSIHSAASPSTPAIDALRAELEAAQADLAARIAHVDELEYENRRLKKLNKASLHVVAKTAKEMRNRTRMDALAKRNRNNIAFERNILVAALTHRYESWKEHDPEFHVEDLCTIVYVELPTGQVSFRIHDRDWCLFTHLEQREFGPHWDGHSVVDKHSRMLKHFDEPGTLRKLLYKLTR